MVKQIAKMDVHYLGLIHLNSKSMRSYSIFVATQIWTHTHKRNLRVMLLLEHPKRLWPISNLPDELLESMALISKPR